MASTGKVRDVLVTGAGSGIGRATALRLARSGDRVLGTVRTAERAEALTTEAAADGLPLTYATLELADPASVDALAAQVGDGIDVVVHNAGYGVFGAVEEVDDAAVERQLGVNLVGPLRLTRRLLPGLRTRGGRVVFVGSLAGRLALPFQAHYSASKAAVAALSDALRIELAPHGVAVTCVEPGDFRTAFDGSRQYETPQKSPYADRLRLCRETVDKQESGAPSPDRAAAAIERLTHRRRPPARLPIGSWSRSICLLHRLLPDRLRELLMRRTYRV